MTAAAELEKQRDIVFDREPAGQLERACRFLASLPGCKVEYASSAHTLRVTYNLRQHTLYGLEEALARAGFHLDHSPLHSIGRKIIYYCEDTACHNLDIPIHPTKEYEREVFVKAYDQQPHGDHDDTPPELRDYR